MQTATAIIELLVGAACLGLAVPLWRRRGGVRVAAGVLGLAGLVAGVNAIVTLAQ